MVIFTNKKKQCVCTETIYRVLIRKSVTRLVFLKVLGDNKFSKVNTLYQETLGSFSKYCAQKTSPKRPLILVIEVQERDHYH